MRETRRHWAYFRTSASEAAATRRRGPVHAVGIFAAPIGIFAWWSLDQKVQHHIAPWLVSDPDAEEEEAQ